MKKHFSIGLLITTLAACGGGGSNDSPPIPTPTTPPAGPVASIEVMEETVSIAQAADLILYAPNEDISNIQWTQKSGEPITLLAKNSKVVSFSALNAGDYSFEVSYLNSNGSTETLSKTIAVTNEVSPISARLSHAVLEQNAVSLRTYFDEGVDTSTITWTQTSGPSVSFTDAETNGKFGVFFDAPSVNEDTILSFEVTISHNGELYSDKLAILVEDSNVSVLSSNEAYFTNRLASVFPYNPNSPVADTLAKCVYSNELEINKNACNFSQSPLIAHVSTAPSVDDIMDHVLVSHQWMGDRFKEYLEAFDSEHNDFKNLLRATTAIVISSDIRPSFYHPYTGAIYLDPDDLWLTPEERDTINQAPDYRSSFGSELQFEMPWRYTKNSESIYVFPYIQYRLTRNLEDTKLSFASLLYHELAHANDYFPSTIWDSVSMSSKIELIAYNRIRNDQIESENLQNFIALDQEYLSGGQNELTKLAEIRFRSNESPSDTQKAYTPTDVANMFKTEGAPQFYSYSSTREDFAILFDGFMMKARYNVDRDVAVTDQELNNLAWGQRGREGAIQIKPRVEFVASKVLPNFTEATSIIDAMPLPTDMPTGGSFWETKDFAPNGHNKTIASQLVKYNQRDNSKYETIWHRPFTIKHLPELNNELK